jgi:hypothetical protein
MRHGLGRQFLAEIRRSDAAGIAPAKHVPEVTDLTVAQPPYFL